MTKNGNPYENALAERVNGILKNEYLYDTAPETLSEARKILDNSVELYNRDRPHMSIGYLTPEAVHEEDPKSTGTVNRFQDEEILAVNECSD